MLPEKKASDGKNIRKTGFKSGTNTAGREFWGIRQKTKPGNHRN